MSQFATPLSFSTSNTLRNRCLSGCLVLLFLNNQKPIFKKLNSTQNTNNFSQQSKTYTVAVKQYADFGHLFSDCIGGVST